jgi:hypothetical protein
VTNTPRNIFFLTTFSEVATCKDTTLTVASSNGNKETEAKINGKPVIVGVNAYIKPLS